MLQDIWNDAVIPALVTLVTAALSILVGVAINALRRWAEKQEQAWKALVLEEVAAAADDAVAAVNQTFIDEIRKGREDGRLTIAEAQEALNRAKDIAIERLGKSGMAALKKIVGGESNALGTLLGLIEAAVGRSK